MPMVLDGEIVNLDRDGRSSFTKLQKRMHILDAAAAQLLSQDDPAVLMVFDVLHLDGHSTLELPYNDRRAVLEGLQLAGPS